MVGVADGEAGGPRGDAGLALRGRLAREGRGARLEAVDVGALGQRGRRVDVHHLGRGLAGLGRARGG